MLREATAVSNPAIDRLHGWAVDSQTGNAIALLRALVDAKARRRRLLARLSKGEERNR